MSSFLSAFVITLAIIIALHYPHDVNENLERKAVISSEDLLRECFTQANPKPSAVIYKNEGNAYAEALKQENRQLKRSPLALAYCETEQQVQAAVRCGRKAGLTLAPRSGGHDYEGYSLGIEDGALVIDMSKLNSIQIDVAGKTATVGPGIRLGPFYYSIGTTDPSLSFPAGTCPSVGLGGHLLGGGHGMLTRKFGLACDALLEARMINTFGDIVLASPTENPDLFWASKGGGGNNFGIVTSLKVNLYQIPTTVTTLQYSWTFNSNNLVSVMTSWQNWLFSNPTQDISCSMYINSEWSIQLSCLYLGQVAGANSVIAPFLGNVPKPDLLEKALNATWLESVLRFGQMEGQPIADLQKITAGSQAESFKSKSDYVTKPLPKEALDIIVRRIPEIKTEGYLVLDSYGGKNNEFSSEYTTDSKGASFPHRNVLYSLEYVATTNGPTPIEKKHFEWIESLQRELAPFCSGAKYVNYVDLDQKDVKAYFGPNYGRLMEVKRKYDPVGLLQGTLSIPKNLNARPIGEKVASAGGHPLPFFGLFSK